MVGAKFSQILEGDGDALHRHTDLILTQESIVLDVISQSGRSDHLLQDHGALELIELFLHSYVFGQPLDR